MRKYLILLIFITLSCADSGYKQSIDNWHKERIENLTKPDGWLTLVGLHWLEDSTKYECTNNGNQSTDYDLIEFDTKEKSHFGYFERIGDSIQFSKDNVSWKIINDDSQTNNLTILEQGAVKYYIIKRGKDYAIRVKDSLAESRLNFKGIERFPIDKDYIIKARYHESDPPIYTKQMNMKGKMDEYFSPGVIVFKFKEKQYKILPIEYEDLDQWFIVFADLTNGESTYEACRFLYIDKTDDQGNVILDFNKSYNPPCVYSDFATCPLPLPDNILQVKIEAGERYNSHK